MEKEKGLACGKKLFLSAVKKVFYKRNFFSLQKGLISRFMQNQPIKKSFFQHTATTTSHRTQTNGSQQISSAKTHCELAVQHPFFETSQSCVSTTVTLSHRFKSSPAIPGKLAVPGATGYLMMADHFSENHESSGDLNRPRSPEVRKPLGYFWFFSYKRKE